MKSMIELYLVIRKLVFLMAHPLFYVLVAVTLVLVHDFSGADGIVGSVVMAGLKSVEDFTSWLFFLGRGHENPDLLFIVSVVMPTIIALSLKVAEKITGVDYLLKRFNFIK